MLFTHTKKRSFIVVRNAGIGLTSADCGQVRNQCTKLRSRIKCWKISVQKLLGLKETT